MAHFFREYFMKYFLKQLWRFDIETLDGAQWSIDVGISILSSVLRFITSLTFEFYIIVKLANIFQFLKLK